MFNRVGGSKENFSLLTIYFCLSVLCLFPRKLMLCCLRPFRNIRLWSHGFDCFVLKYNYSWKGTPLCNPWNGIELIFFRWWLLIQSSLGSIKFHVLVSNHCLLFNRTEELHVYSFDFNRWDKDIMTACRTAGDNHCANVFRHCDPYVM